MKWAREQPAIALTRYTGLMEVVKVAAGRRANLIAGVVEFAVQPDGQAIVAAPRDARPRMPACFALDTDICMLRHIGHLARLRFNDRRRHFARGERAISRRGFIEQRLCLLPSATYLQPRDSRKWIALERCSLGTGRSPNEVVESKIINVIG